MIDVSNTTNKRYSMNVSKIVNILLKLTPNTSNTQPYVLHSPIPCPPTPVSSAVSSCRAAPRCCPAPAGGARGDSVAWPGCSRQHPTWPRPSCRDLSSLEISMFLSYCLSSGPLLSSKSLCHSLYLRVYIRPLICMYPFLFCLVFLNVPTGIYHLCSLM